MRLGSLLQRPGVRRIAGIVLAIGVSFAAGLSSLILSSPLSPLFIAGAVAALAVTMILLPLPSWALYIAIFVLLLPPGLLLGNLHSLLGNLTLVLAAASWLVKTTIQHKPVILSTTGVLIAAYLVWSILSLTWAPNLILGRRMIVRYSINFALFLLITNVVDSPDRLDALMYTLAIAGSVTILAGMIAVISEGYTFGARLQILEMNENAVGTYLILALPGAIWFALRSPEEQKRQRAILLTLLFMLPTLTLVALTGSRGGAIAFIVFFLLSWFWRSTRFWGKAGLLIVAIGLISAPLVFSTMISRFSEGQSTLGGRVPIWQATWQLIQMHPWRGVGIGNAREAVIPFLEILTEIGGRESRSIHNPLLETWAETGLVGLLIYLGILISALRTFIRQYYEARKEKGQYAEPYIALLVCTFTGYMLIWIKGGGMGHHPTYFLMLALLQIPGRLGHPAITASANAETQAISVGET